MALQQVVLSPNNGAMVPKNDVVIMAQCFGKLGNLETGEETAIG